MQDDSHADSPDWLSILGRLEQRVEYLNAQLQELRQSVATLAAAPSPADAPAAASSENGAVEGPAFSTFFAAAASSVLNTAPTDDSPALEPHALFGGAGSDEPHEQRADYGGRELQTGASAIANEWPHAGAPSPGSESDQEPNAGEDEEARREAVRRAVEEARAELGLEPPDTGARLYELWRTSQLRGASGEGPMQQAPAFPPAAREQDPKADISELPGVSVQDPETIAAAAEKWQAARAEPVPLSIVIEDDVRRIELVRVYDTLRRVACAEQASLLNYSPHSVTIALPPSLEALDTTDLEEAARAAFGRDCEVVSDGMRVAVRLLDWRQTGRTLTP